LLVDHVVNSAYVSNVMVLVVLGCLATVPLTQSPLLHRLVSTYSSCVDQPIQRLFFALAAELAYRVYQGDAKDASAHSPPSRCPNVCVHRLGVCGVV
jgi:hypothetical protein